jgi:MFS family permease
VPWACWRTLASTAQSRIVGLSALVEGFLLVTFPAAAAILTDRHHYAMSGMRYGVLVLPELAAAILASLTGFGLARRRSTIAAYRFGLTLSLVAMALILASHGVESDHAIAYPMLMAASGFLGAGFGITVPVLMAYARFLNACAEDASVLAFNALIALGAIAGPGVAVLVAGVAPLWGLAVVAAVLLLALLARSGILPSHAGAPHGPSRQAWLRAVRFLLYSVFALAYAVCAAVIVIWSQLRVPSPPGNLAGVQLAAFVRLAYPGPGLHTSVALASLWGATLAAGRVLLAFVDRWGSALARAAGYVVPILVLAGLIAVGVISRHLGLATGAIFVLAGLGCAGLLPLSISNGPKDVTAVSAALAAGVVAYQLAYGMVAQGLRPRIGDGTSILPLFAAAALIGVVTSLLSVAMVAGSVGQHNAAAAGPKRGA